MLEPGQDKGKEERIIRAGYSKTPSSSIWLSADHVHRPAKVGLTEYMASLKRVDRALTQMTTTNLRANQQAIGDFNELLSEGSAKLQDLFRSAVLEDTKPLEPLHYITKREYDIQLESWTFMLISYRIAVSRLPTRKGISPKCHG